MLVKCPLYYRGSKRSALPHLNFPAGLFVDVFGGSGVVTLNRTGPRVYNEIQPGLCAFMRALRDDPFKIAQRVELFLKGREDWEFAYANTHLPECTYIRYRFSQFGSGDSWGRMRTEITKTRKTETFHAAGKALQGVEIVNLDWKEVFKRYDSPEVIFYCDPPYLGTTSDYGTIDHKQFLERVFTLKGYVAVSGYYSPLYASFPWDEHKTWPITTTKGKQRVTDHENLWIKLPV